MPNAHWPCSPRAQTRPALRKGELNDGRSGGWTDGGLWRTGLGGLFREGPWAWVTERQSALDWRVQALGWRSGSIMSPPWGPGKASLGVSFPHPGTRKEGACCLHLSELVVDCGGYFPPATPTLRLQTLTRSCPAVCPGGAKGNGCNSCSVCPLASPWAQARGGDSSHRCVPLQPRLLRGSPSPQLQPSWAQA